MTGNGGSSAPQSVCGRCGKFSDPDKVLEAGGLCPFCHAKMEDVGRAEPIYLIGGHTHLGYINIAKLAEKQRAVDRRIARAQGNESEKAPNLMGDSGTVQNAPVQRIWGGDGDVPREAPDFAPEPTGDAAYEKAAEEAASRQDAQTSDIWEEEDAELDEFGNVIIRDDGGNVVKSETALRLEEQQAMNQEVGGDSSDPFGAVTAPSQGENDMDSLLPPVDGAPADDNPEPEYSDLDMEFFGKESGVPTRIENGVLTSSYPPSLASMQFDRGPRADFKSGGPSSSEPVQVMADVFLPGHTGTIACVEKIVITYQDNLAAAKKRLG